ncbi:MAG: DegQ family serine endoprotease [Burkholderiales bacterium]|nr:DegQ family serine endoprotease [Burkholderiales bacterium]
MPSLIDLRPPARGRRVLGPLAIALAALAALTCGALPQAHAQTQAAPQTPAQALPDFTALVERVGPSVVNIRTLERGQVHGRLGGLDPNVEEFFKRFGIPLPGRPGPRGEDDQPRQRGVGSGFILDADGFIMTNAHVVDGADELMVTLTDKREFKARVIGVDRRTDIALVKIEASGLPAVKIGDTQRLKVGEWVMAIGSPFGLDNTVTAGIVSAKARDTGEYVPFIQTDVAINPGNSGGPLINLRGEVVGINSQIYSRSGGFMGISFAIPIDEAMRVAEQLRSSGRVIRGRIGVQIGPVTKEVAEAIGMGRPAGALVQAVEEGQAAEKAGVEAGDIIVKVDGKPVEKSSDLPRMIGSIKPGTKIVLQVFRRGSTRDISLRVGEFEAERPLAGAPSEAGAVPEVRTALGLTISNLEPAQKKELRVRGGVRVDAVDGAAARAGLREGDVILALGSTDIVDVKQFEAVVARLDKSRNISVLVRRGDAVNYLVIRPAP